MLSAAGLRHSLARTAHLFSRSDQGVRASHAAPLRAELFSAEQMAQHGRELASSHQLTKRRRRRNLLARLIDNQSALIEVHGLLGEAVEANDDVTPAGEWLLDNFYLIQDQIRRTKAHLPRSYSRQLPCLENPGKEGIPRVYDVAVELVSHGDGRIGPNSLSGFVAAYQSVEALKLGELWAIPIMLRLALIENVRRLAMRIATDSAARRLAARWAETMKDAADTDPRRLVLAVADMVRSDPVLTSPFVGEFMRRLQGTGPGLAMPLNWLEQSVVEAGSTIAELVQLDHRQQAEDQLSISNSVASFRFLDATDWQEFVEGASVVEAQLRKDPAGVYARMDFASRDQYRHIVEDIATSSALPELSIAEKVLDLAQRAADTNTGPGSDHVGYYLMDEGVDLLAVEMHIPAATRRRFRRWRSPGDFALYVGVIWVLTVAIAAGFLHANGLLAKSWELWLPLAALLMLTISQLVIEVLNHLITRVLHPRRLPRMDFSAGIPESVSSLTVIPCILADANSIDALIENLEVRFLGNRSENLKFALLTDFADAPQSTRPGDDVVLSRLKERVDGLNAKYVEAPFLALHRPRRWNSGEGRWMGYERKRGKLEELNRLLREGDASGFSFSVGDIARLRKVRYVITLDADTQLPRDAARELVATLSHPLNQAVFDPETRCIHRGYAILQPRVASPAAGPYASRYARLWGGEAGIDPYTRSVSDLYQDLFGEGSFVGKGIYDVAAFDLLLRGRFPSNRILSHDLLEGCYARAGLVSDIQLLEVYPPVYLDDVSRRHRWIRGDWQLLGWLRHRVPTACSPERNLLSMLSQWKLFDNLRRSLIAPALTILLIWTWVALEPVWPLMLVALTVFFLPPVVNAVLAILGAGDSAHLRRLLADSVEAAGRQIGQAAFSLACLPFEAWFSLDAILRTLWRLLISRKRLLQWQPARSEATDLDRSLARFLATMSIGPGLAAVTAVILAFLRPLVLLPAAPILIAWFLSPVIAWALSQPGRRPQALLSADQIRFLRMLARRTWSFFEDFVGPADNWLPPDNHQEYPIAATAHRTSPTNIGLALLSSLAAFDFAYIPLSSLLTRLSLTFETLHKLERYEGHFYNWYDTQTLNPLAPRYVSSVDSGNLVAHLLTLRAGLLAAPKRPIAGPFTFDGIADTFHLLLQALSGNCADAMREFQAVLEAEGRPANEALPAVYERLKRLTAAADRIGVACTQEGRGGSQQWARALALQCRDAANEIEYLAPWLGNPLPQDTARSPFCERIPSLHELAIVAHAPDAAARETMWPDDLRDLVRTGGSRAADRIAECERLAADCVSLTNVGYDFLYDRARRLLAIGYNVGDRRRDSGFYDLLASEARLATFVGIAQNRLPQEAWFSLGRLLAPVHRTAALVSWGGSMFEFLMPLLVMPNYEQTLLGQTCDAAVLRQMQYGAERGTPWGISESGYNAVDVHQNYQYRAFGVPGLGLKRGLADDLVITPHASALALMIAPPEACANLQRLVTLGAEGEYGLYEAIDYTPSRLSRGQTSALVRSFMAHHEGMTLLSLVSVLLGKPMQRRFESDPAFKATLLLLQERAVAAIPMAPVVAEGAPSPSGAQADEPNLRVFGSPGTPIPEAHLLSNGRYHVMVTNAGGGYSRWQDMAITRWREDPTADCWGTFCYLRDTANEQAWSAAYQPTLRPAERYQAIFTEGRAEFRRQDFGIACHTEIAVSPEDDIEVRRLRLTNHRSSTAILDVTSYAEIVLSSAIADALHPAFNKLFVQTEIIAAQRAIVSTRRPRSAEETPPWHFHVMTVHGLDAGEISFETDRMRFIGRGQSSVAPAALQSLGPLSNTAGSVLDPISAIRYRLTIPADATVTIDMVYGISGNRSACMALVEKYHDRRLTDRVFNLAWTHAQAVLRQINATESEAQLFGRLASAVLYASSSIRADPAAMVSNQRGQADLWGYAISGDLPILVVTISDSTNLELVREVVKAHAYWRLKGLVVDLVILNEDRAGYRQILQEQIIGLIAATPEAHPTNQPGGIFVRQAEQISTEDRVLLLAAARIVISDTERSLADQIVRRGAGLSASSAFRYKKSIPYQSRDVAQGVAESLHFFNGIGGFSPDGRQYVIITRSDQATPAPWCNVIANPEIGVVVSERGAGYTWTENAHEFRLTPWHNDPVVDPSGEAFYIRDDDTGVFWSAAPFPKAGSTSYVTRHGFGFSEFEHDDTGIFSRLCIFVSLDAPVRFSVLTLRNDSGVPRKISVTGYVEWVLGDVRSKTAMHVVTETDPVSGAVYARNPFNTEFRGRLAYFDVDAANRTVTGDRTEFIGRNGTMHDPAALAQLQLSGRTGPALDPCAAIQVSVELAAGAERQFVFRLGCAPDASRARELAQRFRGPAVARQELDRVKDYWNRCLGAIQIHTPDAALNLIANGWLLYQTIAARFWARSGYYQSGGAYGFRDQLQDSMAIVLVEPALARNHLLLCASRQFPEGDVQHWWHPSSGRGIRSHCSDDYLWLPLATARYLSATGDRAVLEETCPFLDGRLLNLDEESYYDLPLRSARSASLYEHCVMAIQHAFRSGEHGLPLMGSGDWNDGMNRVGSQGRGESVWLGFFLYHVLKEFVVVARDHGDPAFVARCEEEARRLSTALEQAGWDGEWYRRAYFDDGSPLGSSSNSECRIDSISQSWAVLSGAADRGRAAAAMQSTYKHLVRSRTGLVQLLEPPFDSSSMDPGYIKGYVPGVRENGGHYTHAAVWAAIAFAELGEPAKAWELARMCNPVSHASSPDAAATYKVEPFVVAADIYSRPPHSGRGGWTWYTGAAGWMYRLIIESLLGIRQEGGDALLIAPCLPADWPSVAVDYQYGSSRYRISIVQTDAARPGAPLITVDGVPRFGERIALVDDGAQHAIDVVLLVGSTGR